jgi:mannose-6-phosphate isomerase
MPKQEELPVRVDKPWGHEIWWAHAPGLYVGKTIHVDAGHKLSVQYHEYKDETSMLQSGRMWLYRGQSADSMTKTEIGPGHVWRNEPGVVHTVEAIEDAVFVEVSTDHLLDVVRLEDGYGREGTNAP